MRATAYSATCYMFHHRKRLIGRFDARLADLIGRLGAASCHVASLANATQTTSSPRRPHPLVGFAARFGSCSRATRHDSCHISLV